MLALVDADIVAYRVSAASEDTDLDICILRCDRSMEEIMHLSNATSFKAYLTGSSNFRKDIYPEYKANRIDKPKPKYLQDCREYLVKYWDAIVSDGCEADDLLGASQTPDSIICTIDKDLLQIPGSHFNWVKGEFYEQTWLGGIRHFYEQLLKGDRSDNIPGLAGIGEKKAAKFLEGCETEQEMYEVCLGLYQHDKETMWRNGKLLWIWRSEGDIWDPEKLEQSWTGEENSEPEMEQMLYSTMQKVEEVSQFTELTTQERS